MQSMQDPAREVETQALQQMLQRELQRRLVTFSHYAPETFGTFGRMEAGLTAVCVGLPLIFLWWLA